VDRRSGVNARFLAIEVRNDVLANIADRLETIRNIGEHVIPYFNREKTRVYA
jgi:archaellum biogenesis protein FlaJ (TadC family)